MGRRKTKEYRLRGPKTGKGAEGMELISFSFQATPSMKHAAKVKAAAANLSMKSVLVALLILWLEGIITVTSPTHTKGPAGTFIVTIGDKNGVPSVEELGEGLEE